MPGTDGITAPLERFAWDVDGDGQIGLGDISGWPAEVFFLPGDTLLYALATYAAPLASFLSIGPDDYGGLLSGVLSTFVWLASVIGLTILCQLVVNVDRRMTQATMRAYSTLTLRVRVARALLVQRLRAWLAARRPPSGVEVRTDIELSPAGLRALALHAELSAGYVLSVSDVARALGTRPRNAEGLLAELMRLGLLIRASCGADGESGYALSVGGRALLEFHERAPKARAGGARSASAKRSSEPTTVGAGSAAAAASLRRSRR